MKKIFFPFIMLLLISGLLSAQPEKEIVIPSYLKPGDTIALVAPSYKQDVKDIEFAVRWLDSLGFHILLGKCMDTKTSTVYCGSEEERLADFQAALDNPSVKAVMATRGGYGAVKLLDKLDFSLFSRYPKWLCGFSDFTAFHSHLNRVCRTATIHSVMPAIITPESIKRESVQSLIDALTGKILKYEVSPNPHNRNGNSCGELVGGNLSVLVSLSGSLSEMDFDGKILVIEDCDEYYYHIDRMLTELRRAGKLEHLAGLIVGNFVRLKELKTDGLAMNKSIEQIVLSNCEGYHFPILFDAPIGHVKNNHAYRLGLPCRLTVGVKCNITMEPM